LEAVASSWLIYLNSMMMQERANVKLLRSVRFLCFNSIWH